MPQISTVHRFAQFSPGTALATYYTVATTNGILKDVVVVNSSTTSQTIRLHVVPSGGTAGVANAILYDAELLPNETKVINLSLILNNGDTIQASASTANVVGVTISGVDVA